MNPFPFTDEELPSPSHARHWVPEAVNYVAIQCWKTHRSQEYVQDLSSLPAINLDVLFEILGYLHPLDLIHLSRVNRAFRELLLSPSACSLWRLSFTHPLPLCPPDVLGRRWANLLFGAHSCDECACPNVVPDYILYRRLCTDCMGKRLLNSVPEYSPTHLVNELVPKTFRSEGSSYEADSDVGRLSPMDATAVAQEYERLQADPSSLAMFIESRKQYVQNVEAFAETARSWTEDLLTQSQLARDLQHLRTIKRARRRLCTEGHNSADVDELEEFSELEAIQCLTSKRWRRVRTLFLPRLGIIRENRLKREREELVVSRTNAAASAVADVLRTAPPHSYAYLPPNYTIETFPPLHDLLHDPSDAPLATDDPRLAKALVGLPEFVATWRENKRQLLASLLPSSTSASVPTGIDHLALATSVYTCKGSWIGATKVMAGRALIGWAGAGAHLRCRSLQRFWDHRVHYSPEGAATARELLRLVGLDPDVATAEEMDRLCGDGSIHAAGPSVEGEKRFACAICPVASHKSVVGRRALRWRECVLHAVEQKRLNNDDAHDTPSWMLLTDQATQDVRRREEPDPFIRDAAWMCTLCTKHYDYRERRCAVFLHLWRVHKIGDPVEGTHFMHYPTAERTLRVPVMVPQPNADGSLHANHANLRCNHCPKAGTLKLWALRSIIRHLIDKHQIMAPSAERRDWSVVELISRSTTIVES